MKRLLVLCLALMSGTASTGSKENLERISFSSFRPAQWDIYHIPRDGKPIRLTRHAALDYEATVSPDGRWLVFTSERDGSPDLFAMDLEGDKTPRKLVESPAMEDQAAFSPDGRKIVFVSTAAGTADLYEMAFEPTKTLPLERTKRLTNHERAELRPVYSADGKRIIFTSNRDSVDRGHPVFPFAIMTFGDLYSLTIASGKIERLTAEQGWDGSAALSPDGKFIYFYSERQENSPRLYRMPAGGGNAEKLPVDELALSPTVMPDGSVIYVTGDPQKMQWALRRITVDGELSDIQTDDIFCFGPSPDGNGGLFCHGVPRALFEGPPDYTGFPGPLLAENFPKPVRLADRDVDLYPIRNGFSAPLRPGAAEILHLGPIPVELLLTTIAGSEIRKIAAFDPAPLMPTRRQIMGAHWSSDGEQIVFAVKRFRDSSVQGDIWLVNADGTELGNLTDGSAPAAGMPDFGAGDTRIVFASHQAGATDIMMMSADGSGMTNLTGTREHRENFPALSPDGSLLAFASDQDGVIDESTGERFMDIYLADIRSDGSLGEPVRITGGPGQKAHPRFSPDGEWIVYASGKGDVNDEYPVLANVIFSPQLYGEIYAYRISDGASFRLTHDKWENGAPYWAAPLPEQD